MPPSLQIMRRKDKVELAVLTYTRHFKHNKKSGLPLTFQVSIGALVSILVSETLTSVLVPFALVALLEQLFWIS